MFLFHLRSFQECDIRLSYFQVNGMQEHGLLLVSFMIHILNETNENERAVVPVDFYDVRVSVLLGERRRHVRDLRRPVGALAACLVVLQVLPVLVHLTLHLRGAVSLHRPNHGRIRNHQGGSLATSPVRVNT